jgi:hypothetical protein
MGGNENFLENFRENENFSQIFSQKLHFFAKSIPFHPSHPKNNFRENFRDNENFCENFCESKNNRGTKFREKLANSLLFSLFAKMKKRVFFSTLGSLELIEGGSEGVKKMWEKGKP